MRIRVQWRLLDTTSQSRLVILGIRPYTQSPVDSANELDEVDGPAADPHADWMAYDSMVLAGDGDSVGVPQRDLDVKSMRRLDEVSDSLALSLQAVDELAAQCRYVVSLLVALP